MQPDVQQIKTFANKILDRNYINVYAIDPTKPGSPPKGKIVYSTDELVDWVTRQNQNCNIYYAFNFPRKDRAKKAHRKDIKWLMGYHVDVDTKLLGAEKELWITEKIDQINALSDILPHIIFTGNGLQALWEFEEPIRATRDDIEETERVNRKIAGALDGDSAHNIDRIMRMPGTINWPDKKKEARGCQPIEADLIQIGDFGVVAESFNHLREITGRDIAPASRRIDYTTFTFSPDWHPITIEDMERERPQVLNARDETDNSLAACDFIRECIFYFVNELETPAKNLPQDVRINIAELVWACDYPFVDHYVRNGRGKLGYDIDRCMDWAADKIEPTPEVQARQEAEALGEALSKQEPETLDEDELRHQIRQHLRKNCELEDLPDLKYSAKGFPANAQPTTEDNLREVVNRTGLQLSWDVMDSCPVFGFQNKKADNYLQRFRIEHTREQRSRAIKGVITSFTQSLGLDALTRTEAFIAAEAYNNLVHPFEGYCSSVTWDGVDRIEELARCIKSPHPMARRFIQVLVYSIAATLVSLHNYQKTGDGVQISASVIFVGKQGIGKSTFLEKLLPAQFRAKGTSLRLGGFSDADNKKQVLNGVFCVLNEIGQSLNKSENEALKDFMATTVDIYRPPFSPITLSNPRMTAFAGTSNDLALKDPTGSRRYLPMEVLGFDWGKYDTIDRQQLFAQAYQKVVLEGAQWWLTKEEENALQEHNEQYQDLSEEAGAAIDYLHKVDDSYEYEWLTMTQIFKVIGVKYHPRRQINVQKILEAEGLEYRQTKRINGRNRRKVRLFPITTEGRLLI